MLASSRHQHTPPLARNGREGQKAEEDESHPQEDKGSTTQITTDKTGIGNASNKKLGRQTGNNRQSHWKQRGLASNRQRNIPSSKSLKQSLRQIEQW